MSEVIYEEGLLTKKLFDILIKDDKTGEFIYKAGKDWKNFDYEKGFNALIQKDKTGKWIYYAGETWPKFDYKKGLDALIQKDKTGKWIYFAGERWKNFDYEKGLDGLIKNDKTGEWLYHVGMFWPKFNPKKVIKILREKFPRYYRKSLKDWPPGKIKLTNLNKKLKNNKQIKPRKFSIKEEILSLL